MEKRKKIIHIAKNILLYLFLAVCLMTVVLTVFSRKDADGASEILGYQMRVVTSDSMAACDYTDVSAYRIKDIPLRSMVFVKVMPRDAAQADEWYRSLRVGDVLTFRYVYTTQVTITHRVTAITENPAGGFLIRLAGDNKNSESGQLVQTIDTSVPENANYVIGKVVGQSYLLGVIISFLMQPLGTVLVIILPCLLIIAMEVIRIVKAVTAEKREQELAEKEEKEQQLRELRHRLDTLEKEKAGAMQAGSAQPTEGKEE